MFPLQRPRHRRDPHRRHRRGARSQGAGWFATLDTAYDTSADVRFWLEFVDAATRARALAAFDALGADADWMARAA